MNPAYAIGFSNIIQHSTFSKKTKYLFVEKYNKQLEVCGKMKNVFMYWIGILIIACAAMFISGLL